MQKSPEAFRTIGEVASWLGVPPHVLRFWESKFAQVKPVKRAGGRRYYRRGDMALLGGIKVLLHDRGMTIKGVQRILSEDGPRAVCAHAPDLGAEAHEDATEPSRVPAVPRERPGAAPPGAEGGPPEEAASADDGSGETPPGRDGEPSPEEPADRPDEGASHEAESQPVAAGPGLEREVAESDGEEAVGDPGVGPMGLPIMARVADAGRPDGPGRGDVSVAVALQPAREGGAAEGREVRHAGVGASSARPSIVRRPRPPAEVGGMRHDLFDALRQGASAPVAAERRAASSDDALDGTPALAEEGGSDREPEGRTEAAVPGEPDAEPVGPAPGEHEEDRTEAEPAAEDSSDAEPLAEDPSGPAPATAPRPDEGSDAARAPAAGEGAEPRPSEPEEGLQPVAEGDGDVLPEGPETAASGDAEGTGAHAPSSSEGPSADVEPPIGEAGNASGEEATARRRPRLRREAVRRHHDGVLALVRRLEAVRDRMDP